MRMTIMGIVFISMSLFCVNIIAKAALPAPGSPTLHSLNQIAAVVNNEIITQTELHHAILAAQQQLQQNGIPLPSNRELRKQVLEQLIYQHLQLQIAKKNHVTVSSQEIDNAITNLAARNNTTLAGFKQLLVQQHFPYDTLRQQVEQQLIIAKLQQQALSHSIIVSKSDVVAFRAKHATKLNPSEYHVADILIPLADSPTPTQIDATKTAVATAVKKLKSGIPFDSVMNDYPDSQDLGWRSLTDLPTLFTHSVETLQPGQWTGPLQAPNGWHIIRLIEKRRVNNDPNNPSIEDLVFQEKLQTALKKWLSELRAASYIQINEGS